MTLTSVSAQMQILSFDFFQVPHPMDVANNVSLAILGQGPHLTIKTMVRSEAQRKQVPCLRVWQLAQWQRGPLGFPGESGSDLPLSLPELSDSQTDCPGPSACMSLLHHWRH